MLHKVVMIDGFPGCGKTMLSPIISAFERVEIMQYAPLIEQICELRYLDCIDEDVAESMVRMNTDLLIYNVMMGRNLNCRPTDLSSIFKHKPTKHIRRMLESGDETIPKKIIEKKPILNLTTHMMLLASELLFKALGDKLIFIEVIRHPLYMVIQQEKNFNLFEGPRSGHVRYSLNNKEYTFFTKGWEETFDVSNSFEKAIYSIIWYYSILFNSDNDRCIFIPFENFVMQPDKYMQKISAKLSSPITNSVRKEMKNQKVPRKQLSDGPDLDIYKRCGWTPPKYFSEDEELNARRELLLKNVSSESLKMFDVICEKYTETYLNK
jgi:hypothetical protein